jgi:hypothetical protein
MWDKTIGGAIQEGFGDVYETDDGGYVLAGLSHSNISGDKTENSWGIMDYWILKLNAAGNIQWQNTIGGTMQDLFHSLTKTDDGGYLIGGWSDSYLSGNKTENSNGGHDYWIVKVDSTGAIQWQNTIGGSDTDALFCVKSIPDGFILCGASSSGISGDKTENPVGGSGFDYWILKTDLLGNILWQSTIGGNNEDVPHDVIQTSDNGYIIVGESESNISGDKNENCLGQTDFWIIKLSPETITSVSDLQVPSASGGLQIFPNPSSGIFQITFPDQKTNWTLEVLNTLGQKVFLRKESFGQSKLQTSNSKAQTNLDLSFLPKGIYILKVYDGVSAFNNKIIID